MKNNEVNVDADDVIMQYRVRVDELEFSNTVLQLQVKKLQKELADKGVKTAPAPEKPAEPAPDSSVAIDNAETK